MLIIQPIDSLVHYRLINDNDINNNVTDIDNIINNNNDNTEGLI